MDILFENVQITVVEKQDYSDLVQTFIYFTLLSGGPNICIKLHK